VDGEGDTYYYNAARDEASYDHPMDITARAKLDAARKLRASGVGGTIRNKR